jgi:hypothetical protein
MYITGCSIATEIIINFWKGATLRLSNFASEDASSRLNKLMVRLKNFSKKIKIVLRNGLVEAITHNGNIDLKTVIV